MTTNQPQDLGQDELIAGLLEGAEPDAWIVIPVAVLSRQLSIDWEQVKKSNKGRVSMGRLQMRHLRSLKELGFLRNTKYLTADGEPSR